MAAGVCALVGAGVHGCCLLLDCALLPYNGNNGFIIISCGSL